MFECFRHAKGELGFTKRLARGRDGAIDLLDQTSEVGAATVAECKYIGSGASDDAFARWREVASHLKKHLPALAADSSKNLGSPYRGWLDPEQPVTQYRFCVTAGMKPEEAKKLKRQIAADFAALADNGVEILRPLGDKDGTAVRVLAWDWFESELDAHPTLAFRWFRGLPAGVELFEPAQGGEATFRDFLRTGELRYFSRDEYEGRGIGSLDRGETQLVAELAGDRKEGLLITGPGGAGKTRLSWELASALAQPEMGFDVYRLGRSAGFESIVELAQHYPTDSRILLLLDYAEAASELPRVADAVEYVTSNTQLRLRLVATCRASAANHVRAALTVLALEDKSLGSSRSGEPAYVEWVARSILDLENLPTREQIERVCHGVPALAAFAVFLHRRHRKQFDAQFGALLQVEDFEKWAAHRISAVVESAGGNRHATERSLARIALLLPLSMARMESIASEDSASRALIGILRDDRWIEHEAGHYVAAHDVLADALAARWIFEAENAATDRVLDLMTSAADTGEFERNIIALERLALHPKFREIDGGKLIGELIALRSSDVSAVLPLLLSGQLMSTEEKLILLNLYESLRDRARVDRLLDGPLSYLAEQIIRHGLASDDPRIATLLDLLDNALEHDQPSNMVLRRAFALAPARFRDKAYGSLAYAPSAEQTHFLLVQMLRSGEPATTLEGRVRYWAEHNPTTLRASFLFNHWLKNGGSVEAIEEPLLAWVAEYGTTPEASYVYKAWLDRDGPIEPVEEKLLAWVAEHGTTQEARFVYSAWLEREGSIEAVEKPLLAWMTEHGTTLEAWFVYEDWLDRGGSIEAVEKPLLGWVAEHGTTREASHVYEAWLERDGSIEAVEKPLMAWVTEHGTTPEAQFVYNAWLDRDGSIEAVEKQLLAWLVEHGTTLDASHVYKAWLDRNGSIEAIEEPLLAWVAEQGTTPDASFVYRAWLNRGGDLESVRENMYAWIVSRNTDAETAFVTRHLVRQHDLPEPVILAIASWAVAFIGHEDGLDRLSSVLAHVHEDSMTEAGFMRLVSLAEDAIIDTLLRERLSDRDRSDLWSISASLIRDPLFGRNSRGCLRAIASVLKSGRVFKRGLETDGVDFLHHTYNPILNAVLNAIRWGELSLTRDREALRTFADWLASAAPDCEGLEELHRVLRHVA